ncbi:hypothetical protein OMP38_00435 [Cohnella ginsengisoli]|uniref:Uncharacterized protein n=1 Tax=Cohnella ginsengisoli TaxID=425004 RepID=A0A9X4QKU3_9BACL|nr:hypothetical protein [Cohnella ginsengisoli]MDG0789487.1 hypothetical protein [Cohnella ginsengisoli]
MAGEALLTPGDVSVIRRYVRTKYAPMPATNQAEIVADAIVRTIRRRLPEWPEALRADVADRLVASCVVGEQREVYPQDVLRVCGDLTLADEAHAASLLRWLNERTAAAWTLERIARRTEKGLVLKPDLAAELDSESNANDSASSLEAAHGGTAGLDNASTTLGADGIVVAASVVHSAADVNRMPRSGWLAPAALRPLVLAAVLMLAAAGVLLTSIQRSDSEAESPRPESAANPAAQQTVRQAAGTAPFAYLPFDAEAVKSYLKGRDSMLAERPYFEAIVESARQHGIDPLLLFAVAGQEQGFVPKSAKKAKQIANNPFNVFNSWETYNTDIGDSSGIAAKLLAKLAAGIPEGEEPFAWMNRTYAEDPLWSDGVRAIYAKLQSIGREQGE